MLFYMFSGSWSSSIADFQSIVVTGFFVYVGYSVGAGIVSISHCFSFFFCLFGALVILHVCFGFAPISLIYFCWFFPIRGLLRISKNDSTRERRLHKISLQVNEMKEVLHL